MKECWFSITAQRQLIQNNPIQFSFSGFCLYFRLWGGEDDLFLHRRRLTVVSICIVVLNVSDGKGDSFLKPGTSISTHEG